MKSHIFAITYVIVCSFGVAAFSQQASANSSGDSPWAGLWVAERNYGVPLEGSVTLRKSSERWIAQVQGERVAASRDVAEDGLIQWSFAFPDLGYFEGQQTQADAPIRGHWVQPAGPVYYHAFASPVNLRLAGPDAFDGTVVPIRETYSLNIPFTPDKSAPGQERYRTFLRNPQRNTGVYFPIEFATIDGDEIRFTSGEDELIATGRITEPGERFTLSHRGWMFEFTRGSRQTSPGFYPRRSEEPIDEVFRPVETGDGWSTAALGATGIDQAPVVALINTLSATTPTKLREPYLHSLLVAHKGKLVLEEYFHGHHRDMMHDSRSAGKTVGSALLGMAIYQGALKDVDQPVYPMFGGVNAYGNPDPRKERLTARHLVTMSPGLACNDEDENSPGNENALQSQDEEPDWYKYALDLPMVNEPGEVGHYCSAGINLVGKVVSTATGMPLTRFFQASFAAPLQITRYHMNLSPIRHAYMGGGIQLRPRDFLKLGQLYLDGGVWNGQRLVSEDWVRESFAAHASLGEPDNYGFGWWRYTYEYEGQKFETYSASGNGGQILLVVPKLDLTIMMNAGNYSDGRSRNALRYQIMWKTLLPAVIATSQ
ncbi:MAG: serine hydrolase domain-containing protein [Gammaproteobacteria bacterium]